jgi:hypothetical protein
VGAWLAGHFAEPPVRRCAEGIGLLAKTDRIDARVIAWFNSGQKHPVLRPSLCRTAAAESFDPGCVSSLSCRWRSGISTAQASQQNHLGDQIAEVKAVAVIGRPIGACSQ